MTDPVQFADIPWMAERDLSMWHALEKAAATGRGLSIAGVHRSYSELVRQANRLAEGLRKLGAKPGDRVCTIMGDTMDYIELVFAAERAGIILVPLNPYLKGRFLAYQLEEAEPVLLFVDGLGLSSAKELLKEVPSLKSVVLLGESNATGISLPVVPMSSAYLNGLPDSEYDADGRKPFLILYTSGTTGNPKGCIRSQGSMVKISVTMAINKKFTSDDVVMTSLPLFHVGGLMMGVFLGVVLGAEMHHTGAFRASTYFEEAAAAGATICMGLGSMGQILMAQPEKPSDRAHKIRMFYMMPYAPAAQAAFLKRFGIQVWSQAYGQTECFVAESPIDGPSNPASAGREMPYMEIGIFDAEDQPLPQGQAGEICARPRTTGMLFSGYWRKPEATLETWRNLWHHTGDRGYIDKDGFLFFVDRVKDSIRRRGENIVSAEVEAAITDHPKVRETAIIAVPSNVSEDDVKACIILHDGQSFEPAELFAFFRDNLPYFAVPRYVEFMSDFPRTGSMKVQKVKLREQGHGSNIWDLEEMGFRITKEERRGVKSA